MRSYEYSRYEIANEISDDSLNNSSNPFPFDKEYSCYIHLWLSVLYQALDDLKYYKSKRSDLILAYRDSVNFFKKESRDLRFICNTLGIPISVVLRAFRRKCRELKIMNMESKYYTKENWNNKNIVDNHCDDYGFSSTSEWLSSNNDYTSINELYKRDDIIKFYNDKKNIKSKSKVISRIFQEIHSNILFLKLHNYDGFSTLVTKVIEKKLLDYNIEERRKEIRKSLKNNKENN